MDPYRFPPSFDNSPLSYGFAVFSLTLVSALSLAQLLSYWFEGRARREAQKIAMNLVTEPLASFSALQVHRMIVSGFLLTILFGALPDVLVLLFWGEAADRTMEALFLIDRVLDGALLFPFLWSIAMLAYAYQAIPQTLVRNAGVGLARPTWQMVRDKLKIIGAVLVLAVGVTLAKAGL